MSEKSKKEYITTIRARYIVCTKQKEKSRIISEVVINLNIHRKSAIRLLHSKPYRYRKVRPGRSRTYNDDLIQPLAQIWTVVGKPCSKRLKPQIEEMITVLKQFKELHLYGKQEVQLQKMSTFTIDRLLTNVREDTTNYGLSGTKTSPLLKTLIPIRTNFYDINEPGHVEADCVLHCGDSLRGVYAETLNMLDIDTHWNEKKMFLKKTAVKIVGSTHDLKKQFPFPIKSLDFDNGREFITWEMHQYCLREKISFTRGRSGRSNDQAHIEGKNNHSIRKVIGYSRITDQLIVAMIDDMYQNEHRLLTNFFYTTMKLKEKKRNGQKLYKRYEEAQTPYQRVMISEHISDDVKKRLQKQYLSLNPAELQRTMQVKLKKIEKKISVTTLNLATPFGP